jgi:UDP-glucose 4-epimerase
MVEQVLHCLNRTLGFSFVALRYFNAAGADESTEIGESHDPETHLIPNVLKTVTGKQACLEIYGDDYNTSDGTCIRDYVHVNDLASAHIAAVKMAQADKCGIGINLGTGHGASVREIVDLCSEISGKKIESHILPRREGDSPVLVANYKRARELLGWTPKYDLRSIIQTAWNWERARRY